MITSVNAEYIPYELLRVITKISKCTINCVMRLSVIRRGLIIPYCQSVEFSIKVQSKNYRLLNKDNPWYSFSKNCSKKSRNIQNSITCRNSNIKKYGLWNELSLEEVPFNISWYKNKITLMTKLFFKCVINKNVQRARLILFKVSKYLLGYNVKEYIQATAVKVQATFKTVRVQNWITTKKE